MVGLEGVQEMGVGIQMGAVKAAEAETVCCLLCNASVICFFEVTHYFLQQFFAIFPPLLS